MKRIFLWAVLMCPFLLQAQNSVPIIPQPVSLVTKEGSFVIDNKTSVKSAAGDAATLSVVHFFTAYVKKVSGIALPMGTAKGKSIQFIIAKTGDVGAEGYTISVNPTQIIVQANTSKGLFYGAQSLLQTMPFVRTNEHVEIPCMEIKDYPRFQWRGLMLDVSRHFFAPELVKEFIDLLAMYKMNVFHWHLGHFFQLDLSTSSPPI